jgi:hypothetical protein
MVVYFWQSLCEDKVCSLRRHICRFYGHPFVWRPRISAQGSWVLRPARQMDGYQCFTSQRCCLKTSIILPTEDLHAATYPKTTAIKAAAGDAARRSSSTELLKSPVPDSQSLFFFPFRLFSALLLFHVASEYYIYFTFPNVLELFSLKKSPLVELHTRVLLRSKW